MPGSSTAGNGIFVIHSGSANIFSNADHGTFTLDGSNLANNGFIPQLFVGGSATLASASFVLGGGTVANAGGAFAKIYNATTCDQATITVNGGSASGALGSTLYIEATASGSIPNCENATFIINGGSNGGGGTCYLSHVTFPLAPDGGTARWELFGNGTLDLSQISVPFVTGSLEGNGIVSLGSDKLTVGTRNTNTTFAGLIQDGGILGGTGGALSKTGTGTLTLTGANTYTGVTNVTGGTLLVDNRQGSATGTGALTIGAATLGGRGIIAGSVSLGDAGASSFLAPAGGKRRQATLTIQGNLTLQPTATYTYTFKARGTQVRADQVMANGVTISSATINLQGTIQGTLAVGTVVTLISNTSANPISGIFNNLPDGAIIAINETNFQANYEGGDGNDLTLTVVP